MSVCTKWEYDRSLFGATISTEWDLVCSNEVTRLTSKGQLSQPLLYYKNVPFLQYLLSVGQTVYFLGMTLGVFLVGLLTDRFGRRPALLLVVATASLFGVATAFTANFETFLATRQE